MCLQPTFDSYANRLARDNSNAVTTGNNRISFNAADPVTFTTSEEAGSSHQQDAFGFRPDLLVTVPASSMSDVLMTEQEALDCFVDSFTDSILLPDPLTSTACVTSSSSSSSSSSAYAIQGTVNNMLHRDDLLLHDFGNALQDNVNMAVATTTNSSSSEKHQFGGISGTNSTSSSIFQFPDLSLTSLFYLSGHSPGQGQCPSTQGLQQQQRRDGLLTNAGEAGCAAFKTLTPSASSSSTSSSDFRRSSGEFSQQQHQQLSFATTQSLTPDSAGKTTLGTPYASYFDDEQGQGHCVEQQIRQLSYKLPADAMTINRRRLFAEHRHVSELTISPSSRLDGPWYLLEQHLMHKHYLIAQCVIIQQHWI